MFLYRLVQWGHHEGSFRLRGGTAALPGIPVLQGGVTGGSPALFLEYQFYKTVAGDSPALYPGLHYQFYKAE